MIARIFPHPLLTLTLVIVWQMLVNYVSLGTLVFGLILGIVIPLLTAPYWPDRPRLKSPMMIVEFILIVLWDITHPGGHKAAPPVVGGRNVDHVCIATGPFDHDELRAHLASHGVAIDREALHGGARGMGHSFYVKDPFGNTIEIKGPAEYPDGRG